MSKIAVTIDCSPANGKQISFFTPCDSANAECLVLEGVEYDIVDAYGVNVAGIADIWDAGALVSVILDTDNHKAYIQNPSFTPGYFRGILPKEKGGTGDTLGAAHIEYGSYVGTGTSGKDNPNSLTFDFVPKLVILSQKNGNSTYFINGDTSCYAMPRTSATNIYLTWTDKTVSWYASDDLYQYNRSPNEYSYVALG